MITIDVDGPLFLQHGVEEVIINRGSTHREMHVPYTDVEFAVDMPVRRVAQVPVHSGNSCRDCGGMMQRTGTCETCTSCGSTGGCG